MLRVLGDQFIALCHLEVGKVKAGRNGATDERVRVRVAQRGAEPAAGKNDGLDVFAIAGVVAEKKLLIVAFRCDDVHDE